MGSIWVSAPSPPQQITRQWQALQARDGTTLAPAQIQVSVETRRSYYYNPSSRRRRQSSLEASPSLVLTMLGVPLLAGFLVGVSALNLVLLLTAAIVLLTIIGNMGEDLDVVSLFGGGGTSSDENGNEPTNEGGQEEGTNEPEIEPNNDDSPQEDSNQGTETTCDGGNDDGGSGE